MNDTPSPLPKDTANLNTEAHAFGFPHIILLVLLLVLSILPATRMKTPDFVPDYTAAWAIINGYDPNSRTLALVDVCCPTIPFNDPLLQNAHPPIALVLTMPFTFLSWDAARWLWLIIGWIIIAFSWRLLRLPWINCLVTLPYWTFALAIGTLEPMLFGLLSIAIVYAERARIAGIALGAAIALKLYPLLMVLAFFSRVRWRTVIITGISTISIFLFAEIMTRATYGWLQYLPENTSRWVDVDYNYSLVRMLRDFVPTMPPFIGAMIISLIFVIPLLPQLQKGDIRLFLPVIFLANPLIWSHYYGLLSLRSLQHIERICFLGTGVLLWLVAMGMISVDGLAPIAFGPMLVATLLIWYRDVKGVGETVQNR